MKTYVYLLDDGYSCAFKDFMQCYSSMLHNAFVQRSTLACMYVQQPAAQMEFNTKRIPLVTLNFNWSQIAEE
jgi:hypothetical protein